MNDPTFSPCCVVFQVMCATVLRRLRLVPCWAGPRPPPTPKPSSPSICFLASPMWVPSHPSSWLPWQPRLSKLRLFTSSQRGVFFLFLAAARGVKIHKIHLPAPNVRHRAVCMSALPTSFQIYHLWCRERWHFHTTCGVERGGGRGGRADSLVFLTQSLSQSGLTQWLWWWVKVEGANVDQDKAQRRAEHLGALHLLK